MSAKCDGINDGWYANVTVPTDWTIACWFRHDTLSLGSGTVAGFGGATFGAWLGPVERDQSGRPLVALSGADGYGSSPEVIDLNTQPDGTWWYVAVTWDNSEKDMVVKILVDGDTDWRATATESVAGTIDTQASLHIASNSNLGEPNNSDPKATFYDVKFWNSIQSFDDLLDQRLYQNSQIGAPWAWYRFANGAFTTDSSGNGRTLTELGNPTYVADRPASLSPSPDPTSFTNRQKTLNIQGRSMLTRYS